MTKSTSVSSTRLHIAVASLGFHDVNLHGQMVKTPALMSWLIAQGHRVSICAGIHPWENASGQVAAFTRLGAEPYTFALPSQDQYLAQLGPSRRLGWLWPLPLEVYFPGRLVAAEVRRKLQELRPDVLWLINYGGLSMAYDYVGAPKVVSQQDPLHMVAYYQWRYSFGESDLFAHLRRGLRVIKQYREQVPYLAEMMRRCDAAVACAAHDARYYSRKTGMPCLYLPTPATDVVGTDWRRIRERTRRMGRWKILWASPLGAPVNRPAVDMTMRDIIPVLDRQLHPDRYEMHFVGRTDAMPASLARLAAERPHIRVRGYVESIEDEFLSSDVVLVPTPIRFGFRTRIVSAFSFGCCVVAHEACTPGMPELVHEHNVLLARNGEGLAEQTIRALTDQALRNRLEESGRRTYERFYSIDVVGERFVAELFRVTQRGRADPVHLAQPSVMP